MIITTKKTTKTGKVETMKKVMRRARKDGSMVEFCGNCKGEVKMETVFANEGYCGCGYQLVEVVLTKESKQWKQD